MFVNHAVVDIEDDVKMPNYQHGLFQAQTFFCSWLYFKHFYFHFQNIALIVVQLRKEGYNSFTTPVILCNWAQGFASLLEVTMVKHYIV